MGEVGGDGGEDVTSMEGGANLGQAEFGVFDAATFQDGLVSDGESEQAVIGTDVECLLGLDDDGGALAADAGVDDCDVDGFLGEIGAGGKENEARGVDIAGGKIVSEVDDWGFGGEPGDHTFHGADESIEQAEVCGEGDHLIVAGRWELGAVGYIEGGLDLVGFTT